MSSTPSSRSPRRSVRALAFLAGLGAMFEPRVAEAAETATLTAAFEPGVVRIEGCRGRDCRKETFALPPEATRPRATNLDLGGVRPGLLVEAEPSTGGPGRYVLLATVDDEGAVRDLVHGWIERPRGEANGRPMRVLAREPVVRGEQISLGAVSERLDVCGRRPTTGVTRLDPVALEWQPEPARTLSADERARAVRVFATRKESSIEGQPRLLEAVGATSGGKLSSAITDGSLATAWTEDAVGPGAGEAIVLRASTDVAISGVTFAVDGTGLAEPPATPKTFFLVADGAVFHVTMPEDAALAPVGAEYHVTLPAPLRAACLALVLDTAYDARPGAVGFRELHAATAFDGPGGLASLVPLLDRDDDQASAATVMLARSGGDGLRGTLAGYSRLGPRGRARARELALGGSCAETASFDVDLAIGRLPPPIEASEGDDGAGYDPLPRLRDCRSEAAPRLRAIVTAQGSDAERGKAARWLADLVPAETPRVLADALDGSSAVLRRDLRDALHLAARRPESRPSLAELLEPASFRARSPHARIELLRGLTAVLPLLPAAAPAFAIAAADRSLEARFLLLEPAAALARAGNPEARRVLVEAIVSDAHPHVRARAAEAAFELDAAGAALVHALSDASPRVRRAALASLAARPSTEALPKVAGLLRSDPWTFVRLAAATTLGAGSPGTGATPALLEAIHDPTPAVRRTVLGALAKLRDPVAGAEVEAVASDATEEADVRVAAIGALGSLCRAESAELLYKLALRTGTPELGYDRPLGMAALAALRTLRLPDRAARLAPLLRDARTPRQVKGIVREVVAAPGSCGR